MTFIAFGIAALYVCLGFAAGTILARRSSVVTGVVTATPSLPAPTPAAEQVFEIRGDKAAEFLDRIHKLTANVDSDVGRHATRVAEISGGLSGDHQLSVSAAEDAARQLLEANRLLQQDLASAKQELQAQRRQLDSSDDAPR